MGLVTPAVLGWLPATVLLHLQPLHGLLPSCLTPRMSPPNPGICHSLGSVICGDCRQVPDTAPSWRAGPLDSQSMVTVCGPEPGTRDDQARTEDAAAEVGARSPSPSRAPWGHISSCCITSWMAWGGRDPQCKGWVLRRAPCPLRMSGLLQAGCR